MESCIIFIPDHIKPVKSSFLIGLVEKQFRCCVFYVCDCLFLSGSNSLLELEAVVGSVSVGSNNVSYKNRNWLTLSVIGSEFEVTEILVDGRSLPLKVCRFFYYDADSFLKSELFLSSNSSEVDYFKKLAYHVRVQRTTDSCKHVGPFLKAILNIFITLLSLLSSCCNKTFFILRFSQFAIHLHSSIEGVVWMLRSYRDEGRMNMQAGSYLAAVLADVILGSAIVHLVTSQFDMETIFSMISSCTQEIIQSILVIIEWLMGSPVGLKLNAPLNQIIGGFFLYHVKLWWTFLELVEPVLKYGLRVLVRLGVLGLTFQAALILDLLVIITLHVYCIYVYAARLYGWHVSGLLSLSKLVLGRKRNPIPGRVDSCPYTTEQLFVGTTSFAVLLFLLPTLLVYYVVFAFLRIVVVIICAIVMNLIYYLRIVPIYTTVVWLFNSERTATTVKLRVVRQTGMIKQHIKAVSQSWQKTVDACLPSVISPPPPFPWAELISQLSMGKLIFPV